MQSRPVTPADLAGSVIAVPPLCRKSDLALNDNENTRLIRHIESGGVRTLLYGGNANLYHMAVSEFAGLLDFLESTVAPDTLVIPSVGPSYGGLMDQAGILKNRSFPTAMILPATFPATPAGVATAARHFVERAGIPAVLYLKHPDYLPPIAAARLVDDGLVSFIKYAIVRDDPADDPFLRELLDLVDPERVVSGVGEQPTITHLSDFGLVGFTSGCVCINPSRSTAVLHALKSADFESAAANITIFRPLEDLRNAHGPIPVLHHAVAEAGIAITGPPLPLLSPLPAPLVTKIASTAGKLRRWNQ